MRDVVIAGVGMTPFGKFPERGMRSLAEEAVRDALADAGIAATEPGIVMFGNAAAGLMTGQEMIRGEAALRHTGLLGLPVMNVENACASGSSAFHLAWLAVASGEVDVAVAVGAEKLVHADKGRAFAAIGTAVDLEGMEEFGDLADPAGGRSRSFFMDVYARSAREYMEATGAAPRDFADVAVKNHHHGALNPKAQYRDEVSADQVLASREISAPLTLLMCSPIGDGAAALVLSTPEYAKRVGADAIRILACSVTTSLDGRGTSAPQRAADLAYARAGVAPTDLDVVELHDATAAAELPIYEEIGLCAAGDGVELLRSGATTLGGRIPVNTSGGLLSKGHPVGATGAAQLVELADQLRGRAGARQVDGARVALAENAGGHLGGGPAVAVVTILAR